MNRLLIICFLMINSCNSFVLHNSAIIKLKPVNNALISINHNRKIITYIKLKKNNIDFNDYKIYLLLYFLLWQIINDINKYNIY